MTRKNWRDHFTIKQSKLDDVKKSIKNHYPDLKLTYWFLISGGKNQSVFQNSTKLKIM